MQKVILIFVMLAFAVSCVPDSTSTMSAKSSADINLENKIEAFSNCSMGWYIALLQRTETLAVKELDQLAAQACNKCTKELQGVRKCVETTNKDKESANKYALELMKTMKLTLVTVTLDAALDQKNAE